MTARATSGLHSTPETVPAHRVRVPGDKSLSHRALIFAALGEGESEIANLQAGEDVTATAGALRALGCRIPDLPPDSGAICIAGRGLHGLAQSRAALDCMNSGTTARLLLGVLAGYAFRSVVTGDASLRSRPMRRVTQPLCVMGARFTELERQDRLPIAVEGGRLHSLDYESPVASAQVKSALLLAGLTGAAQVTVREPTLSRDHTERLLAAMGVSVETERGGDGSATITLQPVDALRPLDFSVPGDFSSSAFFLALGLLSQRAVCVEGVGLNPGRTGLLVVLARMQAQVRETAVRSEFGEPVGDVIAQPSSLIGTSVAAAEIPSLIDEVPVLAVLAVRAEGETTIRGAGELRVKESDRIAVLVSNLRAIGVEAEELSDGLIVRGTQATLRGRVATHGDHRIAMAFGVLASLPGNAIEIDDPRVASVSFPGFWEQLRAITGAS